MLVMASAAACGDNIVDMPDEECDDGNVFTGDGCSGKCKTERMSTSCHPRILSFPACACVRACLPACLKRLDRRACERSSERVLAHLHHTSRRECGSAAYSSRCACTRPGGAGSIARRLLPDCAPAGQSLRAQGLARPHLGLLELVALDLLLAIGLSLHISRVQRLVHLLAHPRDVCLARISPSCPPRLPSWNPSPPTDTQLVPAEYLLRTEKTKIGAHGISERVCRIPVPGPGAAADGGAGGRE